MNFCSLHEQGRVIIPSMPCFLEIDIREQPKHEKRIQTSVDNAVNNSHQSKTFLFFFKQKFMFLFLEKHVFKNPKNSIALAFFLLRQILKEIEMPWQKP